MSATLKLDLHNMQYLTLFIIFFFASCFFVDDVTKSNISVTTCPTVSFIKQTSDLSTRPHTVNVGTKEGDKIFQRFCKTNYNVLVMSFIFYSACFICKCMLGKKNLKFYSNVQIFCYNTDRRTDKQTYIQTDKQIGKDNSLWLV